MVLMKYLLSTTDKDVFKENKKQNYKLFETRKTGKAIILNKKNEIAMVGNTINNFFVFPGGGIEKKESIRKGIERECIEEVACKIQNLYLLGKTEEYRSRNKKHYINYCYVTKLVKNLKKTNQTEDERKNGMYVKWFKIKDAQKLLAKEVAQVEKGEVKFYNTAFNIVRDNAFIIEFVNRYERNNSYY